MEKTCSAEESGAGKVPNGVRFDPGCSPRAAPAGGGRASCFGRSECTRVLVETHISRDLTGRPEDGWGPRQRRLLKKVFQYVAGTQQHFKINYILPAKENKSSINGVFYWKKLVINILNNYRQVPLWQMIRTGDIYCKRPHTLDMGGKQNCRYFAIID